MKRVAGSGIKSWELTDEFWEWVEGFIAQQKRKKNKRTQNYLRKQCGHQFIFHVPGLKPPPLGGQLLA
jgi:predicted TIM-barrel enzyme